MIDDLVRLVVVGIISIDSISDQTIRTEVEAELNNRGYGTDGKPLSQETTT